MAEVYERFQTLVEKYEGQRQDVDISVGLRPSGTIHLGNMSTMTLAGLMARAIGPSSRVNLAVCDLDLPETKDWEFKKLGFARYYNTLEDKKECHPNMLEHAIDRINWFATGLEEKLGVKYQIQLLSDLMNQTEFRQGLRRVIETPGLTKHLLPQTPDGKVLVYPICKQCYTANSQPSKYENGRFSTACTNPECFVGDYEVDIDDLSQDLAVNFLIDPIRDRIVEPKSRIHIFGGDYKEKHGENAIPKIEKIQAAMQAAGGGPDILLGPLFIAEDGSKMSKSKGNGLTMDDLREIIGNDYESKVLELMTHIIKNDLKQVDSDTIKRVLFD